LRVLRLEVFVYIVYITAQEGGGGGVKRLVEVAVNSKEENFLTFVPITSKNSASGNKEVD
jgi:hypothetical protein